LVNTLVQEDPRFKEIVDGFTKTLIKRVPQLRQCWEAKNLTELHEHAHWLKGSAGTVGFADFTQPAKALQDAAGNNDVANIPRLIDEIEELVDAIETTSSSDVAIQQPAPSAVAVDETLPQPVDSASSEETQPVPEKETVEVDFNPTQRAPVVSSLPMVDERFRVIVEDFVVKLRQEIPSFRSMWKSGELPELGRKAHWLKGAGGTVGFSEFTKPAAALQTAAETGEQETISELLVEIEELTEAIVIPAAEEMATSV